MNLPRPRTDEGAAGLRAFVTDPAGAVLGLDYDGTLAPIVRDPAAAYAHPGAGPALHRLGPLVDTIVIITGRPAATAVRLGGLLGLTGLVVLGQYGRERWEDGMLTSPPPPPGVETVRAELPRLLVSVPAPEGTAIEDKGLALAVHTRNAADPDAALTLLRAPLEELAARTGLTTEPGRYVIELRPPGVDKGGALRAFAAERKARSVMFAGDDLGDLTAYAAVDELRAAGTPGVKVCSGSAEVTELAERADLVVDGPDGMVALMDALAGAIRGG
ncbi:MAG: trehalose-phosphatase [Streptosporangiales bacterium]|nr:trehalose-phosphatase [Streptosporangiales bacterium]